MYTLQFNHGMFSIQMEAGLRENKKASSISQETTGCVWIEANVMCTRLQTPAVRVCWSQKNWNWQICSSLLQISPCLIILDELKGSPWVSEIFLGLLWWPPCRGLQQDQRSKFWRSLCTHHTFKGHFAPKKPRNYSLFRVLGNVAMCSVCCSSQDSFRGGWIKTFMCFQCVMCT